MKPQGYSLVEQVRARSLVFDRGDAVMVPLHTAPALALRAAELALAGFNQLGHAVYRREEEGGR